MIQSLQEEKDEKMRAAAAFQRQGMHCVYLRDFHYTQRHWVENSSAAALCYHCALCCCCGC
jgi:hypothetical protein